MSEQLEPKIKITKIKDAQAAGTSAVTSNEIDQKGFDGFIAMTAFGTAAAGNTAKLQSTDTTGSGYADVAGSGCGDASNPNVVIACHKPVNRFHEIVCARGTSSTMGDMWLIQYGCMTEAQINDVAATLDVRSLVSPAFGTP